MAKGFDTPNDEPLQIPADVERTPAWFRLSDQLGWYDRKSVHCQRSYKFLRGIQVALAVSIPITGRLGAAVAPWVTGGSGAAIALLEALQHLNQYSTLWVMYRGTAERLKHEKYLFLSGAGPYRGLQVPDRLLLLAERVEEHVSAEHANWFDETRGAVSPTKKTPT